MLFFKLTSMLTTMVVNIQVWLWCTCIESVYNQLLEFDESSSTDIYEDESLLYWLIKKFKKWLI